MQYRKLALVGGSLYGALAVGLGALGAHALETVLDADALDSFKTATRFQMYHALFLLLLGTLYRKQGRKWLRAAIWLTLIGIFLFSGSIYLLTLAELKIIPVVAATPIGGSLLIGAWLLLFGWALKYGRYR